MVQFRRKLYRRGSSFETTIPLPLLFSLDSSKKYDVVFDFDKATGKWNVDFEERFLNTNDVKKEAKKPVQNSGKTKGNKSR